MKAVILRSAEANLACASQVPNNPGQVDLPGYPSTDRSRSKVITSFDVGEKQKWLTEWQQNSLVIEERTRKRKHWMETSEKLSRALRAAGSTGAKPTIPFSRLLSIPLRHPQRKFLCLRRRARVLWTGI